MRILIVEDSPKMRELLKVFLGDLAEIRECADGDEVLESYIRWQPEWVVMDVHMQRVGGITATRLLKNAFPESKVVMLSKHRDLDIQAAALDAGASEYLTKDDLNAVRQFLLVRKID